jgi:hypothetical protein
MELKMRPINFNYSTPMYKVFIKIEGDVCDLMLRHEHTAFIIDMDRVRLESSQKPEKEAKAHASALIERHIAQLQSLLKKVK